MTPVLSVTGLSKEYPGFRLQALSFEVAPGSITGFVGRNGAGKTTTLKALLNLVHPSAGQIRYFGLALNEHEREIKQRIGYAVGGVTYYKKKKLRDIVGVTRTFYDNWDEAAWQRCADRFALDGDKTPEQLSEGMRVKFHLALALSHRAELLLLDEPTSGLDPVSRGELLELLLALAREGVAVFFSTHIISDLEKCADRIVYLRSGRLVADTELDRFAASWRVLDAAEAQTGAQRAAVAGETFSRKGGTVLIPAEKLDLFPGAAAREPGLEEIMLHLEKAGEDA